MNRKINKQINKDGIKDLKELAPLPTDSEVNMEMDVYKIGDSEAYNLGSSEAYELGDPLERAYESWARM